MLIRRSLDIADLFITAGGNQIDAAIASNVSGESLGRADAKVARSETGFAIGRVAPAGHLTPSRVFFDPTLLKFDIIYVAVGRSHHIFQISRYDFREILDDQLSNYIYLST